MELRNKIIKLAHNKTQFRRTLLPILKEANVGLLRPGSVVELRPVKTKLAPDGYPRGRAVVLRKVPAGMGLGGFYLQLEGRRAELFVPFEDAKAVFNMRSTTLPSSDLRNRAIKLAYENPNLRGDLLPVIKQADMERQAKVWESILKQIGRVLPKATKVKLKEAAKKIRAGRNPESVVQGMAQELDGAGRRVGLSGLGQAVLRFGRNISPAKVWAVLKAYLSGAYEEVLRILGVTPSREAPILTASANKEAVLAELGFVLAFVFAPIVLMALIEMASMGGDYLADKAPNTAEAIAQTIEKMFFPHQ